MDALRGSTCWIGDEWWLGMCCGDDRWLEGVIGGDCFGGESRVVEDSTCGGGGAMVVVGDYTQK